MGTDDRPPVEDRLQALGAASLGEDPSPDAVEAVLRRWVDSLDGADPLRIQVERDALAALEGVRAGQVDAALATRSGPDPTADRAEPDDVPEELREAASELLEAPELLDRALETMRARGLVAEGTNARLLYLSAIGGTLDAPIHVVVHGESAAGKNTLARRAFELLPPRYVLAISGLSEHALEYRGGRIEGVLLVDEAEGQGRAEYGLRVAMSEGRLTRLTVNKGEDGRNRAQELEVEVAASVVTTTTAPALHAENQTRVFDLYVDEGEDVTREVLARRAQEAAGTAIVASDDRLAVWRAAVELLEPAEVVIPWAETLADGFPTGAVRARRDFPRVLALVEASALLHQRQRPRDEAERIVATPGDWRIVRPLVQAVLGPSMTGINETARQLAALHDELVADQAGPWLRRPDLEKEAGARDIASANTVHRWAKRLAELGVWEGRREAGKAWEHRRIRDVVEEPIPLPEPEKIAGGFPTLPTPPNSGGGKGSAGSDKGSDGAPTPPMVKRETGQGGGDTLPDTVSKIDWEAPENPGDTRGNAPYHGGLGGLGGVGGSDSAETDPETAHACRACGDPIGPTADVCGTCKSGGES